MEEKILVKRAKKGDVEAFGALYKQVYRKLYQYALYTLRSAQDAEDVVSEAVVDAFAQISSLKKEESFYGWLSGILCKKCRKKMREYYRPEDNLDMAEEQAQEEQAVSAEHLDLRESFFQLPNDDRMILSMHIFLGYKTREIAEYLQMNENTVRSRESRALKKLESQLEP